MFVMEKILYVDDEIINLELFKINFGSEYQVLTAKSGMEGLQILDDNKDLMVVISDMKMPQMNGIEFVTKVKEINPGRHCFILTGFGLTSEIAECIKEGLIIECLTKPFDKAKISREITKALAIN